MMGVDCDLVAFPPGQEIVCDLDRLAVFDEILRRLGTHGMRWTDRLKAIDLLKAFSQTPVRDYDEETSEYDRYWRGKAEDFLHEIIEKYGNNTPVMILEEQWKI